MYIVCHMYIYIYCIINFHGSKGIDYWEKHGTLKYLMEYYHIGSKKYCLFSTMSNKYFISHKKKTHTSCV